MPAADAVEEAQLLEAEVITAAFGLSIATRELADMGICASPADASVWMTATNRQRLTLALQYAVLISSEPDWKAR